MLTKVKKSLDSTDYLSFTVDAWTSKNQLHSLLALTVHYIDEQFLPKYYVLDAQPIVGSHRAENYESMIQMFRPFLLTIFLLFFVGNFYQFMVEGMDPNSTHFQVEGVKDSPPTQGNQNIEQNSNVGGEAIEFSSVEILTLLIKLFSIKDEELSEYDIINKKYIRIQDILVKMFASSQDTTGNKTKLEKLCSHFEKMIEDSYSEFLKNLSYVDKMNYRHKRLYAVKKYTPNRLQQLEEKYNFKFKEGEEIKIIFRATDHEEFLNELFKLNQAEKNDFIFYNLVSILCSFASKYAGNSKAIDNAFNVVFPYTYKFFDYISSENKIFRELEYTVDGEKKKILKRPEDFSEELKSSGDCIFYLIPNSENHASGSSSNPSGSVSNPSGSLGENFTKMSLQETKSNHHSNGSSSNASQSAKKPKMSPIMLVPGGGSSGGKKKIDLNKKTKKF